MKTTLKAAVTTIIARLSETAAYGMHPWTDMFVEAILKVAPGTKIESNEFEFPGDKVDALLKELKGKKTSFEDEDIDTGEPIEIEQHIAVYREAAGITVDDGNDNGLFIKYKKGDPKATLTWR